MSRPICQSDPAYLAFCLQEAAFARETIQQQQMLGGLFRASVEFGGPLFLIALRNEEERRKRRQAAGLL